MRLHRPYIPIAVRLRVAIRQLFQAGVPWVGDYRESASAGLLRALAALREVLGGNLHLDHDPALVNRMRRTLPSGEVVYSPDANDHRHLVYRSEVDHDIKTRVRGDGAQRSDLGQRRYLKRVARNRQPKAAKRTSQQKRRIRAKYQQKQKWPSRPLRSASNWPKKGEP